MTNRPIGVCVLTRYFDHTVGGEVVRVDQADPRILISKELAVEMVNNRSEHVHAVTIAPTGETVITIEGINRRVIYRLGEYQPEQHAYLAEWPD